MFKVVDLFRRKKSSHPFKNYYTEWIETLKNTLLPLLRHSISSSTSSPNLLSTHVEMIHRHFQSYYETLDAAASNDVAQLLFPEWRNSLEKPFLWLGDLHPYLFTNLLRSFLENDDELDLEIGESCDFFDKPWPIVMAFKSPSRDLMTRIDQIECGVRLMVPALVARARSVQVGFVDRVGVEWGNWEGRKEGAKAAVGEAVMAQMDEMISVFEDANRLRRSVLAEIMSSTSIYQAALFYEGLAQFLVGFRDRELVHEFERCKLTLT